MKSLRKAQQSNAVDSVMKPVLEDSEEDQSDEGVARESSSGDTPPDESSESFQLARRETVMVKYSKICVIVVIIVVAIAVASLTFAFVRNQEHNDYTSTVSQQAQVCSAFVISADTRLPSFFCSPSSKTLPMRFWNSPNSKLILWSTTWNVSVSTSPPLPNPRDKNGLS